MAFIKSKSVKMAKQTTKLNGDVQGQSINLISEGTKIKGNIVASGDIRIDGELTGNISVKGRLVVGPNGKINGEVDCNNVEVSGTIKGKVNAGELLNMKSTARIDGDIIVGKLSVEPGTVFVGTCKMGASAAGNETKK